MVWPRAASICKPAPSLPVLGTDKPPVATMTASHRMGTSLSSATAHPVSVGVSPVTRVSMRIVTPCARA